MLACQSRGLWYLFCERLFRPRQIPALIINCASNFLTVRAVHLFAVTEMDGETNDDLHGNAPTQSQRITQALVWLQEDDSRSIRGAGCVFSVGESTLRNRLNGAQSKAVESSSRRLLSKLETKEVAKHARLMQSLHFPLTPADIRLEAERILHARNDDARRDHTTLGPGWYSKVFLVDNPEMKSKRGKGYDQDRALSASHNQLKTWYNEVRCLPPVCSIFTHLFSYSILG